MQHLLLAVVLAALCPSILAAQGSAPKADAGQVDLAAVKARAVEFLVGFQERYEPDRGPSRREPVDEWQRKEEERLASLRKRGRNEEWPYQGVYRVGGLIPPGYRVGGTAIACWALMSAPGWDQDADRRKAVERGLDFIVRMFQTDKLLDSGFKGGYDVRGWAHAYGLLALVEALEKDVAKGARAKRCKKTAQWLCKVLAETEIPVNGGWNYSRRGGTRGPSSPSTFMTASTLLILYEARAAGFDVDAAVVERGLEALERGRDKDSGAFQYATGSGGPGDTKVPGACARMAIAEMALHLAGRSSIDRLRVAVDAFFEHWDELWKRHAKTGTHVGPYGIAPYYFHYGHTYAAQAIELLPENERPALRERLRELYWRSRYEDGTWNDRIFPRSKGYGTAMALLGLCMPEIGAPPEWKQKG